MRIAERGRKVEAANGSLILVGRRGDVDGLLRALPTGKRARVERGDLRRVRRHEIVVEQRVVELDETRGNRSDRVAAMLDAQDCAARAVPRDARRRDGASRRVVRRDAQRKLRVLGNASEGAEPRRQRRDRHAPSKQRAFDVRVWRHVKRRVLVPHDVEFALVVEEVRHDVRGRVSVGARGAKVHVGGDCRCRLQPTNRTPVDRGRRELDVGRGSRATRRRREGRGPSSEKAVAQRQNRHIVYITQTAPLRGRCVGMQRFPHSTGRPRREFPDGPDHPMPAFAHRGRVRAFRMRRGICTGCASAHHQARDPRDRVAHVERPVVRRRRANTSASTDARTASSVPTTRTTRSSPISSSRRATRGAWSSTT